MFVCQIWISLLFSLSLYSYLLQFYFGRPELLDSGHKSWKLDSRRWTVDVGLWTLDSESWTLDAGFWTLDDGVWTLDSGPCTLDPGRYTLDAGLWTLDIVIVSFRTESEPNFWLCLIKLLKILWVRISKDLRSCLFCRDYRFWCGYF